MLADVLLQQSLPSSALADSQNGMQRVRRGARLIKKLANHCKFHTMLNRRIKPLALNIQHETALKHVVGESDKYKMTNNFPSYCKTKTLSVCVQSPVSRHIS